MTGPLYILFFLSGVSGLIYQVVWVRVFGNVFGNTVYSTSLVVAVFMLGLGVGSYAVGAWADRRYAARPESLLRAYGVVEIVIATLGLGISLLLPHLVPVSALISSYAIGEGGWHVLSATSYAARVAIALILLTPITLLMGGTLTLLIRHLVRRDLERAGWRIAVLYSVNTAGAALGCLLTDFTLVPAYGLLRTQLIAVMFNVLAAAGAFWLAGRDEARLGAGTVRSRPGARPAREPADMAKASSSLVWWTSLAIAMSGFAALGMEILWFRHFTILLGQFRAVFSLLLTIILAGIGAGSLVSGALTTRFGDRAPGRAVESFMVVQALFVISTLAGLAAGNVPAIDSAIAADPAFQVPVGATAESLALAPVGWVRVWVELWFNAKPMLIAVAVPALLMGFGFPFANAIVQRAESAVGRRAGVLYLANTAGAVCGSLAAGFLLLPAIGIQRTALVLGLMAAGSVIPIYLAVRRDNRSGVDAPDRPGSRLRAIFAGSLVLALAAIGVWWRLPSDFIISRALPRLVEGERMLALDEGLNEVVAVTDAPGRGRRLLTNGHPMSSTAWLSQRYMRALAHVPLLSIERPETALVIGFGVGNTLNAVSLHPSIVRIEVADLSRDILHHADYFKEFNGSVLADPRVAVFLNDGRHHLQMQPPGSYDLVTLEPPPIGYAGVASLYSREFYALARSRLKPKGYVSQWLPTNQVPSSTALAMTRAFIDVFPSAVLISGADADLLLLGTNDDRIEIDPERFAARLAAAPAVQADLSRLDMGTVREVVGAFVSSARTMAEATATAAAVTDDYPIQEYGVKSLLNFGEAVPTPIVDLSQVADWCPRCFADGRPVPLVAGLDTYMALLDRAYLATPAEVIAARQMSNERQRRVAGSAYLGAIVPETADLHNYLGVMLASRGLLPEALDEFRQAIALDPESAEAHWHLGAALASQGSTAEAVEHLRASVRFDPDNGRARYDLASLLLESREVDEAVEHLEAAARLVPDSAEVHNNLGIALGWQGRAADAVRHFERALVLKPDFAEARRNLAIARRLPQPPRGPGR